LRQILAFLLKNGSQNESLSPIMKIGIPKETHDGEQRVAASILSAKRLIKQGFEVLIESTAGVAASFLDTAYEEVGCKIINDSAELYQQSDIIFKVRPPAGDEISLLKEGTMLISFFWPAQNEELMKALSERKISLIAMDCIPRITRAQKMDALSSMANIAGYRAVVEAANNFGSFFTAQMTAAGKVPPVKVLVIGAGVAGLSAIGCAKSMGAIVRSFDTRPEVKEQVESMGAEFLLLEFEEDGSGEGGYAKTMSKEFIDAEMALFKEQAKEVDIIITTALIPGRRAPVLITKDMVDVMKPGSVIVDMAAEQQGNCEVTKPGEMIVYNSVKIIGYLDLPSRMAAVASNLYGNNLCHLMDDMGKAEEYKIDLQDDVVRTALILHEGKVMWPPPPLKQPTPAPAPKKEVAAVKAKEEEKKYNPLPLLVTGILLALVGQGGGEVIVHQVSIFILACFIGYQVIWSVTAALHTPLMSVTNAISGIIIIGGITQLNTTGEAYYLGLAAIFFATLNIAGGFYVTQRMLKMFEK
jgi:NAD(P) transhydrogenase subunit alpha